MGGEGRDASGALARAGGVAQRAVEWVEWVGVAEDSVELEVGAEVEVVVIHLCK